MACGDDDPASFSLGEGATREVTIRFAPEDEGEAEAELRIRLASQPGRP